MNRREVLTTTAVASILAAAGEGTVAYGAQASEKPAFVLVHGAWHGAWCFADLIPYLTAAGHVVVAKDLPGHGLNSKISEII